MKKIRVSKDGPYIVSGNIPLYKQTIEFDEAGQSLKWSKPKPIPHEETYRLCRCGKSKNMPFCDSSHMDGFNGIESTETSGYQHRAINYESLCASARFCDRAGTVWELINHEDQESTKILKEEVANCPSGRLVLVDEKGREAEQKLDESITITHDPATNNPGPVWVKGCIEIESQDGEIYEKRNRVTLCRCGKSKNKPFCDGSHMK